MKKKIISTISCVMIILLMTQTVFAFSPTQNSNEHKIAENMDVLENALLASNTDVVSELNKLIEQYEEISESSTSVEEVEKMNGLIATLETLISEYQLYNADVSTYKLHPIYTPAIAAVLAFFHVNNYLLADELLTHAVENTEEISIYVPSFGARARNSDVIQQIGNGTVISGSASFEPGDSPVEMDLYYAIHAFDYFKSSSTSRVVVVFDTYDFEHDDDAYDSIQGVMVETLYLAQEAGILTPYFVLFEVAV